jgi:hypothetical protein
MAKMNWRQARDSRKLESERGRQGESIVSKWAQVHRPEITAAEKKEMLLWMREKMGGRLWEGETQSRLYVFGGYWMITDQRGFHFVEG